jgi:oligopeptide/dipeptide ABC transporter ATP-binding protein
VVEEAAVDDLFARPRHPYTIGLLRSIPRLDEPPGEQLVPIPGQPPDLACLPSGCAFHPRCPWRMEICTRELPRLEVRARERVYACFADVDQPQPEEAAHG